MNRPLWSLLIVWTLGGLVLPFLGSGAFGWWDRVWVVLFAVAAYAEIAGRAGLSSARVCAGIVLAAFAAAFAAASLAGLPVPFFTPRAGPDVAGLFPLLPPVLLFAILSVSDRAAAVVFPYAGRAGHAGWTALGFVVSVVNGTGFLAGARGWWAWHPASGGWTGAGVAVLAVMAFGLSFVYPADPRMRRARWSVEVAAWLAINILFLGARFAIPVAGR